MITLSEAFMELVPSSRPHQFLHDLMGRYRSVLRNPKTLWIQGRFQPGLYLMELETQPDTFPSESLMLHLKQWPSLEIIPSGPFDFDHTQYKMQVPMFRVHVDQHDCGLVWCEVPCPEDMRARRIRAAWGFEITSPGEHEITLEIPADEDRLRWMDLATLTLHSDHRYSLPVKPVRKAGTKRPRLFIDDQQLHLLATRRDANQQAILDNLITQLESDQEGGSYAHRTVTATLVGLLTGKSQWIDEAIARTMKLCGRPYWGYHDTKEVMGWNSDRDTAMRLFETAIVYDWLYDKLTDAQRERIRSRLIYFTEYADKITHLQYGYWFTRTSEAHGQGLWFGLGCAALVLLDEEPRAARWLEWFHGNIHDALTHAPEDGISEWGTFNVQWLILSVMLLERHLGRRLRGRFPFLPAFARNILHFQKPGGDKLPLLLFFLADRHRNGTTQADALACAHLLPGAKAKSAGLDPLTLLAYDPSIKPSRPTAYPKVAVSQGGIVACRDAKGEVDFTFRCGTPITPRQHRQHAWNTQGWYALQHSGGFSWVIRNQEVVPLQIGAYRKLTHESNMISIDGAGHRMDTRYLGGRIPLEHVSRIEHRVSTSSMTYCHANNSTAYMDSCDIKRLVRRWVFFHKTATLVMHDLVEMAQPHLPAWHIHTTGAWRQTAPLSFVGERNGSQLAVRVFSPGSPSDMNSSIAPVPWVPPYGYGLNDYKTRDWQPELYAQRKQVPEYQELTICPPAPVLRWELITVLGPDPEEVEFAALQEQDPLTTVALKHGSVTWSAQSQVRIEALQTTVDAELVICEGRENKPERWTIIGSRGWGAHPNPMGQEPVDLLWYPNTPTPKIIASPMPGQTRAGQKRA